MTSTIVLLRAEDDDFETIQIVVCVDRKVAKPRVVEPTVPEVVLSKHEIDRQRVARFIAGDTSAFNEIVIEHRETIMARVLRMLNNNWADAEEITQDTFLRAFRGLPNFRYDSSLLTWLTTIASNLSKNKYWHSVRRGLHSNVSIDSVISENGTATLADYIPDDDLSPAEESEMAEMSATAYTLIDKLERPHRVILVMRVIKHMAYEEIADAMNVNVGTVKSRIARAREQLRKLIAECSD